MPWFQLHEQVMSSHMWGWVSLGIWCVASMPQIWENHRAKSSGLTLPFIVLWTAGDGSTVACTLFTHQKAIVVALAVYCFTADCVLWSQHLLFGALCRTSRRQLLLRALLPPAVLMTLLNVGYLLVDEPDAVLGEASCWLAMVFFTASRLPQIVRGCMGQIDAAEAAKTSKLFMLLLILGNVTYLFSVLDEGQNAQIIGTAIAMLSDIVVFAQFSWLRPPPAKGKI
jgi:hypothetical protein